MMEIDIDGLKIGGDNPCRIIAEVAQNHMGDLALAMNYAVQAKRCGADIVKFQHHDKNDIRRMKYALTINDHVLIKKMCEDIGILYLCTPFSIEAAKELNDIGVKAFKVGSGQSGDWDFIDDIAQFEKPILVSHKEKLTHVLCNLQFDLIVDNLKFLNHWAEGYSCHQPNIYTALAAIALGAKIVEKHVIWDKKQICPDQYVSIDFNELKELVEAKKQIEESL